MKSMFIMENGKTAGHIHQAAKEWSGMLMKKYIQGKMRANKTTVILIPGFRFSALDCISDILNILRLEEFRFLYINVYLLVDVFLNKEFKRAACGTVQKICFYNLL